MSNGSNGRAVDARFLTFPYRALAAAALDAATQAGASYADFRFERLRSQQVAVHDRALQALVDVETVGFAVRVVHNGAWGFASSASLEPDAAAATARRAVEVAAALATLNDESVELAPEPSATATWVSGFEIDPFTVADGDKIDRLLSFTNRLLDSGKVDHADAWALQVLENKYFASSEGSDITQQRIRVGGDVNATAIDPSGEIQTMRTLNPPRASGWERFAGRGPNGYDFDGEMERMPDLLAEKLAAPGVEPGTYDLVIDPSHLFLTIHESIGHATELDRALGYEANYAGTSFATIDKLNTLKYGSEVMHVTGDRNVANGLSTVGYDDEGVAAQQWDIVKDGILVGYQLNRQMAIKQGFGRSNGCAYADSPHHVPIQRMPNVSLQPSPKDISLDDLIGGVDRGIYIVGDGSWSIDMQRYNFQFGGQRFYEIRNGALGPQLKDVAYQGTTTDFWGAMEAVGGKDTWVLGGAFNCGKGQPGQVAPVSHGCPPALFRGINVLNTKAESGR